MIKNVKQLVINNKKSYDDFNVYISSRNIAPPKKKSIKESVPFSNVVYDFSKMNGELYWEERTLQYSFDIAEITTEDMEVEKSRLENWLMNVQDEDIYDPYIGDYHFHGSYDSHSWSEDFGAGELSVTFLVYPYKISNSDSNVIEKIGISDGLIEGNYSIAGLRIDGNSVQDGKPTLNTPFEIESVENNIKVLSCGKNLLNILNISPAGYKTTVNGIQYTLNDDGSITVNGTATENAFLYFHYIDTELYLPAGTYRLSYTVENGELAANSFRGGYDFKDGSMTWINSVEPFTLSEGKKMFLYIVILKGDTVNNLKVYPQLERGDTITSFEKYKGNESTITLTEPLRSLPNGVRDTYENGVITRRIGRVVFDGTETWVNAGYNYSYASTFIENFKPSSYIYSNYFQYGQMKETIWMGSQAVAINYGDTITDLETLKSFLVEKYNSGNPVYAEYELLEPIIETIEQPTITGYKDVTNILVNGGIQTTFEVYYNDTKTITIMNNSSHRIAPTITSTGRFTMTLDDQSYSIGEGTYNSGLYLETGENVITLNGYGEITFSYVEEVF